MYFVIASSLMAVRVKNMEESMESLERSLCDFVTLYGKEQQALKDKVEVLESLLSICMPNTPTTVQSVRNEVSASPKRLFSPKIAHKRIAKVSAAATANGTTKLPQQLPNGVVASDVTLGQTSPSKAHPAQLPKRQQAPARVKSALSNSANIRLEDIQSSPVHKAKSQVNLAMESDGDDVSLAIEKL